jgi:UTP--glucose-1-phosphate uridylyltransferase
MKGLIVAAGYGTRFLPATKTVPKEMLPLITKPSIAFIVEEFIASGIEEIVILSSRRKKALDDYFDRETELEAVFRQEGAGEKLKQIAPYQARFSFVRQQEMKGTGHALLQVRHLLEDGPFVTAYPDDLHFGEPPLARQLMDVHEKTGASVMAALHDPPDLNRYGVLKIASDGLHVEDMVEKPSPGEEPSREVSIGRYLYTPDIFPLLQEGWKKHRGAGEYYHLYALKKLMTRGQVVYHPLQGRRLDIGAPAGYFEAILRYAAEDPELRSVLDRVYPEL